MEPRAAPPPPRVLRLERSGHAALIHDGKLCAWGGLQVDSGDDLVLPSDEIWLYDLDSGTWEVRSISGEVPPELSGFSGSYLNGSFYVFGGCAALGYSNMMYTVDLTAQSLAWRRAAARGVAPTPRSKHSCWVHKDRLIFFGGYGSKTLQEVRDSSSSSFIVEETSWSVVGTTSFRCWGWNNEVNVFDSHTDAWTTPQTTGPAPAPRGWHAAAVLGNKGFICGGLETRELDLYSLDLDTWTWTRFNHPPAPPGRCLHPPAPPGRCLHTLTPTSDHTLLLVGGLGGDGDARSDAWRFDALKNEWKEMTHKHQDKPRLWHSACPGRDNDVVVFGGSEDLCIQVDSVAVLRSPCQQHCQDVLVFQTQPYSLSRLCEELLGSSSEQFEQQVALLPARLAERIYKRLRFHSDRKVEAN